MTASANLRLTLFAGTALMGTVAGAAADVLNLDTITVLATRTEEKAIDSLAGVSVISSDQVAALQPAKLEDIFQATPGMWTNTRSDDPGIGFNVRGLQDFGRVAVIVDGARQNFLVAQHGPQGKTYLDPALVSNAEVSRGPVSNIYGSGAIGGVVSMNTKDVDDVLGPGERYGTLLSGVAGTNQGPFTGSAFIAARPNEAFDFIFGGSFEHLDDYKDGNGDKVENTGSETASGLAKVTFRPSEGQEVKLGAIIQRFTFDSGAPGDPADVEDGGTDYGNTVDTRTFTGKYKYDSPDNPLIDFELSGFWSETEQKTTVKEQYATCSMGGTFPDCPDIPAGPGFTLDNVPMDFTGPVGTTSGFDLVTYGFDTHNNARFDALGMHNTLTVGGDYFNDDMDATGSSAEPDAGFLLTGSGTREAHGAFVQWLAEYGTWLDVISAVRYDGFNLEGAGHESSGDRFSPKITVGVTPLDGFTVYGTYAEGYRAPTVVEAFASGEHPGKIFLFLPNPDLRPETGHTIEAGVNLKYDNILGPGDAFRLKADVFRNNVTDYIGLQPVSAADGCSFPDGAFGQFEDICYQYQNTSRARIEGVEVEATYDTGDWFVTASGSSNSGKDLATGEVLPDVLKGQAYVSAGVRVFDRRLTIAPNWRYASGGSFTDDDGNKTVYDPYNIFGMTFGWQPNERVQASLIFNNIFNEQYTPYFENNPAPGFSVKAALTVKLAAK